MKTDKIVITFFLAIVFIVLSVFTSEAGWFGNSGFKNEPKEFRGMEWGTDISKFEDMVFIAENIKDSRIYEKKQEKLQIGSYIKVDRIGYFFFKNKFFGVQFHISGEGNILALENLVNDKYGKSNMKGLKKNILGWEGVDVMIILTYEVSGFPPKVMSATFTESYQPIAEKMTKNTDSGIKDF